MRALCLTAGVFLTTACFEPQPAPVVNAQVVAALDHVLRSAVAEGHIPGAVALITSRDNILYRSSFGVMDPAGAEDMRPDAIFRIASMTKPITSVGILMLFEEGLLDLDDPASDYLPELTDRKVLVSVNAANSSLVTRPASRPITIRDLLRHTSGFGYSFASHELIEVEAYTDIPPRAQPILHDPGARWTYGMSTAFLGWIIEEISG